MNGYEWLRILDPTIVIVALLGFGVILMKIWRKQNELYKNQISLLEKHRELLEAKIESSAEIKATADIYKDTILALTDQEIIAKETEKQEIINALIDLHEDEKNRIISYYENIRNELNEKRITEWILAYALMGLLTPAEVTPYLIAKHEKFQELSENKITGEEYYRYVEKISQSLISKIQSLLPKNQY